MNNNNMEYYNLELVECNCCGTHYGGTDNNIHGYYNCCYECGNNKYEEEQEEKETPVPQLNFDMISKILNIRMESKKDDRYKNNYNNFVKSFNEGIASFKDDILRDSMGYEALYHDTCMEWSACVEILKEYELHDLDCKILSPVEDNEPDNNLNYVD